MIVAFDANIHGKGHAFFNRGMIRALLAGYRDDIELFINDEQAAMHDYGGPRLTIRPIKVYGGSRPLNLLNAALEAFRARGILKRAERAGARLVVALSLGPIAHYLLKRAALRRRPKAPVLVCLHGELQALVPEGPKVSSAGRLVAAAARISAPGALGLVLGDSIRRGLAERGYPTDRVLSMIHPYERQAGAPHSLGGAGVRAVAPGGAALIKGSHELFKLAAALRPEIEAGRLSLSFCGSWDPALDAYDNGLAAHGTAGAQLPIEEYDRRLTEADFFIYLYPRHSYELMASGALFDALRIGRPVLALRTGYFDWAFTAAGEFGRLFDGPEELAAFLRGFSRDPDRELYASWLSAIEKARDFVSPEALGPRLRDELELYGEKEH